ncbi:hypothetical protein Dimus_021603 [Dionaea muscipula]
MNDFHGLLSSDFGFKPQGKSAPMAPPRPNPTSNAVNSAFNFETGGKPSSGSKSSSGSFIEDHDTLIHPPSSTSRKTQDFSILGGFDDVFGRGGNSKPTVDSNSAMNLDSIFSGSADTGSKFSSLPVFDKPVYDDDVFDGVSGLKSSSSDRYGELFNSSSKKNDAFGDLLGGLGRKEPESKGLGGSSARGPEKGIPSFDDLLPGFGGNSTIAPTERTSSNSSWRQKSSASATNTHSNIIEDPFVVLESSPSPAQFSSGVFNDPLEQVGSTNSSSSNKVDPSTSGVVFDDIDPLEGLGKSVPAFSSDTSDKEKGGSPLRPERRAAGRHTFAGMEASDKSNVKSPERGTEKKILAEDYRDSPRNVFPDASAHSNADANFKEKIFQENVSPRSHDNMDSTDDIWLTVSEVPLFTQTTAAPPPSRPPPPRPTQFSRAGVGSFTSHSKKKVSDSAFSSSTSSFQSDRSAPLGTRNSYVSPIDELEDFAMGKSRNHIDGSSDVLSGDDTDANSVAAASAAAMKEAMDKAEAKFRHAKEVRERENAKAARMQQERGERTVQDAQEREVRERQERRHEKEKEEAEERRIERELRERQEQQHEKEEEVRRRIEREREEKEREQRKLEREREFARQAVERATREARERAASEARARAERHAVEKAQAEARERAERAAVQRAQAEARERAARDAKEKAEKAAAEARERARAQARERESRERATTASTAARGSQQKNDDDFESFFGMGSRASSAPRPRASSSDPVFDAQFQNKQTHDDVRTSAGSSSNIRKASSSANIVDDLNAIFGGPPSSGEFQDVEGENEERRRARLERQQRTQERAAKALAEKNQRDLQVQREQAERYRIAETLDLEIKRWAAGKEGNLRALLSTLQYVLWPECGWQPVSLTDLITAASVKKVYRKSTLCIHPDKVQQKGASLQQKYIAEKVFDILKEAWNKFNSEELF